MSKSIKLKNNNYWDTEGITHKKELLSNIIEALYNGVGWLDGNTNLDKIVKNGVYDVGGIPSPINPTVKIWGTLIIIGKHYKFQILIGNYPIDNKLFSIRGKSEASDFTGVGWRSY